MATTDPVPTPPGNNGDGKSAKEKDIYEKDVAAMNGSDKGHTGKYNKMANEDNDSKEESHKAFLEKLGGRWLTVEPVVIIYMVCYTILVPLLQQYCQKRLQLEYNITKSETNATDREACLSRADDEDDVLSDNEKALQARVSQWNIILIVLGIVPTLFVIFFIGSFTDARGRKWALVPQVASSVVMGVLITLIVHLELSISAIPVINFIVGLTGSMPAVMMGGFAYIADITPPEKRFIRLLIIEIGSAIGTLLGQLFFGYLIDATGFMVPAIVFTAIQAMVLAYTVFFLPETVLVNPEIKPCTCAALADISRLWRTDDSKGRRMIIWISGLLMFSVSVIHESPFTILTFYLLGPPLCFNSTLIGAYNGCSCILKALGGLILMKLLFRRIPNAALQAISITSGALLYLCLGMATETWVPFLGTVVGCGQMILDPVTRSIASNSVPGDQQGNLFAGLSFAKMLALLIGSPMYSVLYASSSVENKRYIFFGTMAASIIPLALVGCSWLYMKRLRNDLETAEPYKVPSSHLGNEMNLHEIPGLFDDKIDAISYKKDESVNHI